MARRFIVNNEDITYVNEENFEIVGDEVKHIQVLRHNIGDEIVVNEYICKIAEMKKESIVLEIIKLAPKVGEPNISLTLYMAMLKNDKMDYVVQKAVELGVKYIVPFFSKNVIVKLDQKSKEKRLEKLQKIADEACKQCGRTDTVEVLPFISFTQVVISMEKHDVNFFAYENEKLSMHEIMQDVKQKSYINNISCIVGPEGGFTSEEADFLKKGDNVRSLSLGSRILRAETAALNIISVIMYELD